MIPPVKDSPSSKIAVSLRRGLVCFQAGKKLRGISESVSRFKQQSRCFLVSTERQDFFKKLCAVINVFFYVEALMSYYVRRMWQMPLVSHQICQLLIGAQYPEFMSRRVKQITCSFQGGVSIVLTGRVSPRGKNSTLTC